MPAISTPLTLSSSANPCPPSERAKGQQESADSLLRSTQGKHQASEGAVLRHRRTHPTNHTRRDGPRRCRYHGTHIRLQGPSVTNRLKKILSVYNSLVILSSYCRHGSPNSQEIESLQVWLPEHDPRARHLWSRSVVDDCTRLLNKQIHILSCLEQPT